MTFKRIDVVNCIQALVNLSSSDNKVQGDGISYSNVSATSLSASLIQALESCVFFASFEREKNKWKFASNFIIGNMQLNQFKKFVWAYENYCRCGIVLVFLFWQTKVSILHSFSVFDRFHLHFQMMLHSSGLPVKAFVLFLCTLS